MEPTEQFVAERPRLVRIASRVLNDATEAEDVAQEAWLRFDATSTAIDNAPAWLTTVTTRICLDRLKARTPEPTDRPPAENHARQTHMPDPAEHVAHAESIGQALHVVLDTLSPHERVAFVLHDTFAINFATIAAALDTTPVAARKLASRARAKISDAQDHEADRIPEARVVDAFMAAARGGDFTALLQLLAPGAFVRADSEAIAMGTPQEINTPHEIATFFNGSAHAALAVVTDGRPGAAWYNQGQAMVLFDFVVTDGLVAGITFRAEPTVLSQVVRRRDHTRKN